MTEHGHETTAPQGLIHASARMTTTGHLEQGRSNFEDGAAGDFEIQSTDTQGSSSLAELDRTTQQALEDGQMLVLKQRHRPSARTAVIGV